MKKGFYLIGAVLLGVGVYLLVNKIKNGNISFNPKNEDTAVTEIGSHLEPPMEVPTPQTPPLATPPLV
jgi:hypothetical protein